MMELIEANWSLVGVALVVLILLAWWIFAATRRTNVQSADKPDEGTPAKRNQALIDAPPVAAGPLSDVAGTNAVAAAPATADAETGPAITPTTTTPTEAAPEAVKAVPTPAPAATPAPAPAPTPAAPATGAGDDLSRIKGVGPKLVAQLQALGVTRFAQIAAWDEAEIDRIDDQLGRFKGRIRRDSWVAQAKFLATGDQAGFEGQFGKI